MNSNRDKGVRFEQELCTYLRPWWPEVERTVATGYRTADRARADRGDIMGVGTKELPVVIQAKDVTKTHPRGLMGKALADLLAQTRAQRDAAGAVLGLLVEKRAGFASPEYAWAHLDARELWTLMDVWEEHIGAMNVFGHRLGYLDESGRVSSYSYPVRMQFGHLVELMVTGGFAGWAEEDDDKEATG